MSEGMVDLIETLAEIKPGGDDMPKLFENAYPDDASGWAHKRLAEVAKTISQFRGERPLDPDTRIYLVIEFEQIDRDDLPENLRPLYDEIGEYLRPA